MLKREREREVWNGGERERKESCKSEMGEGMHAKEGEGAGERCLERGRERMKRIMRE